jgi:hypothetical protein
LSFINQQKHSSTKKVFQQHIANPVKIHSPPPIANIIEPMPHVVISLVPGIATKLGKNIIMIPMSMITVNEHITIINAQEREQ